MYDDRVVIIVTGTQRSGTSMWMQILVGAGYPVIGERFPRDWGETLREANRGGFWESTLRSGINFQTNPNPQTGTYVRPDHVRGHAVKVFIEGLTRTDLAYIGRVIVTVRHWRAHAASVQRLWRMEDEHAAPRVPRLDPVVGWFARNFSLMADIKLKGYPARICTYEDLLEDPRARIGDVLTWLGGGDLDAATEVVRPDLQSRSDAPIDHEHGPACDVLYRTLRTGQPPDPAGHALLVRAHAAMLPVVSAHDDALTRLRRSAPPPSQPLTRK